MRALTLSEVQIKSLAELHDDSTVLPILWRARTSRNKALLAALLRSDGDGLRDSEWQAFRLAYDALATLHKRFPAVVEGLMRHPRLGAWAAVAAADGVAVPGAGPHPIVHFGSFVAAAACATEADFSVEVPVTDGAAVLPGVGCWNGVAGSRALVRRRGGKLFAEQEAGPVLSHRGRQWHSVRTLRTAAASAIPVEFDDLPPTPAAWPWQRAADAPKPLSPSVPASSEEFQVWRRRFNAGIVLVGTAVPELAMPLRTGLRSLIPLGAPIGTSSSATLADAFGAWAMTTPADVLAAATGLVHEFQHSKLGALAELVPLVAVDGPADLYSPWRREMRPASAILHGMYAHAALAMLWLRVAETHFGSIRDEALGRALTARAETIEAGRDLVAAERLTPAGRGFVGALIATTEGLGTGIPAFPRHVPMRRPGRPEPPTAGLVSQPSRACTANRTDQ